MDRPALVTGATGFVGSHLAERLATEGWRLRALIRRSSDVTRLDGLGAELLVGDLEDGDALVRAVDDVEVVFHLAAVTAARDQSTYRRVNADGTRRLVEACARLRSPPRRFIYLSSYAACGPALDGRPRTLADPPAPLTAYGKSKLEGEQIARALGDKGVEVVVVRAPAVYGPRDRDLLTYFRLVWRRVAPYPAGPERRLHLVYAPDLARSLARSVVVRAGTYAVAEPVAHTWREVIAAIARALGRRPLPVPVPAALVRGAAALAEAVASLFGRTVAFNREKAREMLARAWLHDLSGTDELLPPGTETPLSRGIAETAHWYRQRGWL
ncbi:MAG: NAD-dependent epimerase/dehydratase family protein [Gemmatimonadetes bacterium]|nr:NAD-dependent epimerase/dehydratase family protein [Gemmatimonadota bacterium]